MKTGDYIAIAYVVFYAAVVFFFPFAMQTVISTDGISKAIGWDGFNFVSSFTDFRGLKNFGSVVEAFPYTSGFIKVGLLATFGEMVKTRGRTGEWKTPKLFPKFIVWGLYGMLFTYCFALFAKGAGAMMGTSLWPFGVKPYAGMGFADTLIFAFTTSLWMNLVFCYPMMLSHEWCNQSIMNRRLMPGSEFLEKLDKRVWGSFMLKTIVFFWIPAHTITFCLPADYRVLMSAVLSLALGFILTVKPK